MRKNAKRWLVAGSVAGAAALGYAAWSNRRLFLVNDVTTGESAAYPHLRSRVYYADAATALAAAEQSIRNLARWRVVFIDGENDALEAEAETPVGNFLDDVTVYVQPLGHGQARVTIRSRSRLGRGDLGQNALHIRELQDAMDIRLTADAAF
jgi:uncharacterized protein (DUF1499 family)